MVAVADYVNEIKAIKTCSSPCVCRTSAEPHSNCARARSSLTHTHTHANIFSNLAGSLDYVILFDC